MIEVGDYDNVQPSTSGGYSGRLGTATHKQPDRILLPHTTHVITIPNFCLY